MSQREILFRGKTIRGDWVEGLLAVAKEQLNGVSPGHYISNKVGMPFAFQIRPETLGQYTGLKDKNGVKIFEGDMLKWCGLVFRVEYKGGCFVGQPSLDNSTPGYLKFENFYDAEITGNIHDNPELIS